MRKLTLSRRLDALERNMDTYRRPDANHGPAPWLAADPRYRAITEALERAGYQEAWAYDPKSGKRVFVGTLPLRADDELVEAMKGTAPLLAEAFSADSLD